MGNIVHFDSKEAEERFNKIATGDVVVMTYEDYHAMHWRLSKALELNNKLCALAEDTLAVATRSTKAIHEKLRR